MFMKEGNDMRSFCLAVCLVACFFLHAAPTYNGPVKAQEVRAREGVGNFLAKLKAGKTVTVAYLGGSITAMNGWRNMTTGWLQKANTNAVVKEVHAAIGGTGSDLGVFRVGHDALRHKPDLLFVEFATNDGGRKPEEIWRSMEGIVRRTWKQNSQTDIIFTYTITTAMTNDYLKGMCNRSASAMEQLADHYGIPSICFGPRVIEYLSANKLVMSAKEYENAVSKDDLDREKKIKNLIARDPRILFARDGVHPTEKGHQIYLVSVANGFREMWSLPAVDHASHLSKPFMEGNLEAAKMVPVRPEMLFGSWRKLAENDTKAKAFGKRTGDIWYAREPGDTLTFKFKGSCCKIYDLVGPDGGQLWITVDGVRNRRPVPRFDSYCTYHRIATLGIYDGTNGIHEVNIEVDKNEPSRQAVAFRLQNPDAELSSPKYRGTKFWPSQILLVGDLVQ
jgi:lysophospholipase L1-like esterase